MSEHPNIDRLLADWEYDSDTVSVRKCVGEDGRDLIQMRVDLGVLQLETIGRPDGTYPGGEPTFLDFLLMQRQIDGEEFQMTDDQCSEADREFVQFYHRRVCWLALREYQNAVRDADHTLSLMDACTQHSPDEQWTVSHEQFRPFVLFHRTQAAALGELELNLDPEAAVEQINKGLTAIHSLFCDHDAEELYDEDELVGRLTEFRETLREEYEIGATLHEQLAEAVAKEQYELAARLRDELARRE